MSEVFEEFDETEFKMEQILFHTSLLNKVQLEKDREKESGPSSMFSKMVVTWTGDNPLLLAIQQVQKVRVIQE